MSDESRLPSASQASQPRAVGAPLSRGDAQPTAPTAQPVPPSAPLASPNASKAPENGSNPATRRSGMQRAAGALRAAVPFVQRLLPLLEGNIAGAVSNVLAPQPKSAPAAALAPLEEGMVELHLQQRALGQQVAEQQMTLKRVEDRLQSVREATDRNTLEQQELMENLRSVGRKVNIVAVVALVLLLVSVALNLFLVLHLGR